MGQGEGGEIESKDDLHEWIVSMREIPYEEWTQADRDKWNEARKTRPYLEWRANPDPVIVFAFDSDEAGEQATLDAIERHWQDIFGDDDEKIGTNSNWVREAEEYDKFLDIVLRAGLGTYLKRNNEVNYHQIRGWSVNRLTHVLMTYQKVIAKCLFFGQSYNIAYVLPACQKIEAELIAELGRRATPKIQSVRGARNQGEFLKASDVLEKIDKQRIYAYYLPDLKLKGQELYATCPFHKQGKELRPSWSANPSTGLFRCKTCNTAGSLFEFIKLVERCDYNAAINKANEIGA